MSAEVPSEEPLPSHEEMLQYLIEREDTYYPDYARTSTSLGRTSMICVVGPSGDGKSTLVHETTASDPEIREYISSTTREPAPRDRGEYRYVTIEDFYKGVREGVIVNYFVHPNGNVYGTFLDGFHRPYTIGAIAAANVEQLQNAGFRDTQVIFPVMTGETYATRIGLDRIHQPDILPRLKEGIPSLEFGRLNAGEPWLTFLELDNIPGSLQTAADKVSQIARHHSVPSVETGLAIKYIGEMEAVIREAIRRINVQ